MHCIRNVGNSCEFWRLSLEKSHKSMIIRVFRPFVLTMMDFCGFFQGKSSEFAWIPDIPYTMQFLRSIVGGRAQTLAPTFRQRVSLFNAWLAAGFPEQDSWSMHWKISSNAACKCSCHCNVRGVHTSMQASKALDKFGGDKRLQKSHGN